MTDPPPGLASSTTPIPAFSTEDRIADLRCAFLRRAQSYLHEDGAEPCRAAAKACLANRGFDLARLDSMPIGLMPTAFSMQAALSQAGFAAMEIRASGLVGDSRLTGRLVGPIADPTGRIITFWAWSPTGEKPRCLYAHRGWKGQVGLCGMDIALPTLSQDSANLLIVEDILDALMLQSHGLRYVAAIAGSGREMTPERWHRSAAMGVSRATLVLGDCPAWGSGTSAAIRQALRAEAAPEIYVLPAERLPAMKGLGDTVQSLGINAVAELLQRNLVHGCRYLAHVLLAKHKQGDCWTDVARQAAMGEAMQFYGAAHPRNIPQLDAHFVPPILEELGLAADGRSGQSLWFDETAGDVVEDELSAEPVQTPLPMRQPPALVVPTAKTIERQPADGHLRDGICAVHGCDRMKCFCWD